MSKTINLLPDPVIETQKEVSTIYQGTLVSIIGLIVFLLVNLLLLFFLLQATNKYDSVQTEISAIKEEINSYSGVSSDLRMFRDRIQRYVRLDLANPNTGNMLQAILEPKVEAVFIQQVQMNMKDVIVTASTPSLETAVEFLRSVKKENQFAKLTVTDIGYLGADKDVTFKTSFEIIKN